MTVKRYCIKAGNYDTRSEVYPVVLTEADKALIEDFVEFLKKESLWYAELDFLEVHYKEEVVYD